MNWNVRKDGPMVLHYFKSAWIENLVWTLSPGFLGRFSFEDPTTSGDISDLEAHGVPRQQRIVPTSSVSPSQDTDGETRPVILTAEVLEPVYICLYRRKDDFWRLQHARVRRDMSDVQGLDRGSVPGASIELSTYSPNKDRLLFLALREKLLRKRPSQASLKGWKSTIRALGRWLSGLFKPVLISRLELWEVRILF
jgi:hypothetical protein